MKNNFYLLLTLILIFNACEADSLNKETPKDNTPHEIISGEIKPIPIEKKEVIEKKVSFSTKLTSKEYRFSFEDLQNNKSLICMRNDLYSFSKIQQPIVMITLFSTWCPPCRGQIPHLSNLQKKFKKELFILGALVHDDIKEKELKKFIVAEKALFFISKNQKENLKFAKMITPKLRLEEDFPMPLMILFFKGKYFTHYEGKMPEEMIESDIEQLIKKIKNKKD